jgi:hypothetical protein
MPKKIQLFLFLAGVIGLLIAIVLLLNFTAPNPTGRRYSSAVVPINGQSQIIGRAAEDILALDLGVPRNEGNGTPRECICRSDDNPQGRCDTCFVSVPIDTTVRIPDFVTSRYIADSKNQENLVSDAAQIRDFALAAHELNIPLWVYVRVNSRVAPDIVDIVAATGGGVIYYFAVPGYHDPVDAQAKAGLLFAGFALLFSGAPVVVARIQSTRSPNKPPDSPVSRAANAVDYAEEFMQRTRERLQKDIDNEDSRNDPEP